MGVDLPDVRFVCHMSAPASVHQYQQETGRGGRDGGPCRCVLWWGCSDAARLQKQRQLGQQAREQLQHATAMFKNTNACRHKMLLEHFTPELGDTLVGRCASCDNCLRAAGRGSAVQKRALVQAAGPTGGIKRRRPNPKCTECSHKLSAHCWGRLGWQRNCIQCLTAFPLSQTGWDALPDHCRQEAARAKPARTFFNTVAPRGS